MKLAIVLSLGLFLLAPPPAAAKVYKWIDGQGRLVVSETPPPPEQVERDRQQAAEALRMHPRQRVIRDDQPVLPVAQTVEPQEGPVEVASVPAVTLPVPIKAAPIAVPAETQRTKSMPPAFSAPASPDPTPLREEVDPVASPTAAQVGIETETEVVPTPTEAQSTASPLSEISELEETANEAPFSPDDRILSSMMPSGEMGFVLSVPEHWVALDADELKAMEAEFRNGGEETTLSDAFIRVGSDEEILVIFAHHFRRLDGILEATALMQPAPADPNELLALAPGTPVYDAAADLIFRRHEAEDGHERLDALVPLPGGMIQLTLAGPTEAIQPELEAIAERFAALEVPPTAVALRTQRRSGEPQLAAVAPPGPKPAPRSYAPRGHILGFLAAIVLLVAWALCNRIEPGVRRRLSKVGSVVASFSVIVVGANLWIADAAVAGATWTKTMLIIGIPAALIARSRRKKDDPQADDAPEPKREEESYDVVSKAA